MFLVYFSRFWPFLGMIQVQVNQWFQTFQNPWQPLLKLLNETKLHSRNPSDYYHRPICKLRIINNITTRNPSFNSLFQTEVGSRTFISITKNGNNWQTLTQSNKYLINLPRTCRLIALSGKAFRT